MLPSGVRRLTSDAGEAFGEMNRHRASVTLLSAKHTTETHRRDRAKEPSTMANSPSDDTLEPEDLDGVSGGNIGSQGGGAGAGKLVMDESPKEELTFRPL
jgi:hypothetical protein